MREIEIDAKTGLPIDEVGELRKANKILNSTGAELDAAYNERVARKAAKEGKK